MSRVKSNGSFQLQDLAWHSVVRVGRVVLLCLDDVADRAAQDVIKRPLADKEIPQGGSDSAGRSLIQSFPCSLGVHLDAV